MFTSIKRILKFGWQGFSRNKGLGFQVIFIMIIVVSFVTAIFLFTELSVFLIEKTQDKVDISVYFKKDVAEGSILEAWA